MYVPAHFEVNDPAVLHSVIREFSFATMITHDGNAPFATHLPILLEGADTDQPRLVGHMARANPQWRHFANGQEVLVIFEGPHAYISPSWYDTKLAVPTWNYVAVHAYGKPETVEDPDRLSTLINTTVGQYESGLDEPWQPELPEDFRDGLLKAIVGFEIPITRMEGKFKLSQNRTEADITATITALKAGTDPIDRQLADWMERHGIGNA
jgi:transcriptional regulator